MSTREIESLLDECQEFVKYPAGRSIIAHRIISLLPDQKSGVVKEKDGIETELTKDELCEWAADLIQHTTVNGTNPFLYKDGSIFRNCFKSNCK